MNTLSTVIRARGFALALFGGALALAVLPALARADAGKQSTPTLADKAAELPLKVSITKDDSGKNEAPMIVHLKNDSAKAITVSGTIDLSVVVHNRPKSRAVPEHKIEPGAVLTIDNLAPDDRITLNAEGYAPLVVVVPYKT